MKAKEVLTTLNITRNTLHNYVKAGKIKVSLLSNNFYDYDDDSVFALLKTDIRFNIIYARVSTSKQKPDLNNQINKLKNYCSDNNISYKFLYSEISNGIDLDRSEFTKLLIDVIHYRVKNIFITNNDRLTRLSFKTLQFLFSKFGTSIIAINEKPKNKNSDSEVFDELISIIHTFSMKMYSNRRKKNVQEIHDKINLFNK